MANQIIANFVLDFLVGDIQKPEKKIYTSYLPKDLESQLAFTASIAFSTTNSHYLVRERLESYLSSNYCQDLETQICPNQQKDSGSYLVVTLSDFFTNASDIPNIILSLTKAPDMGYSLWHKYYYCMGIKNLISADRSLCKYIWEVILCMILTDKGYLRPDIWPEPLNKPKALKV